jgi:hypothetical protein
MAMMDHMMGGAMMLGHGPDRTVRHHRATALAAAALIKYLFFR